MTIASLAVAVGANTVDLVKGAKDATAALDKIGDSAKKLGDATSGFGKMERSLRQFDDVLQLVGGPSMRDVIQGVGQLNDVATGASGKLDGFAKAGLSVSAAMGGWQIGRKLAEFLGTDKLIGDVTSRLMGWGDVAGQQAAAAANTLALASKNAGRQITDLTEAIKINEAAAKQHSDAVTRANGPAMAAAQMAAWRKEIDLLRDAGSLDALKKQVLDGSIAQADLAKMFGISGDALKLLTSDLKKSQQAQDDARRAAEQHAKAIQSITDKLSGAGAIKAANDMIEALKKAPPVQKLTAEAQEDINKTMEDAIAVYTAQGKVAPEAMRNLYFETMKAVPVVNGFGEAFNKVGESVKLTIPPAKDFAALLPPVKTGVGDVLGLFVQYDIVPPKVQKVTDNIGALSKSLAQLAQVSGGAFGSIVRDLSSVVVAIDTARKAQTTMSEGFKSMGSGDILGGIAGVASGIGGVVTAAIAAVKAVGGLLSNIFGLGTAGRDAVKEFAASFGGFDALHAKLLTLGTAGEALWIKLTQGVGRNNPEQAKRVIEEINAALAGQDAWMARLPGLIEKYGLSWEQAGQKANQARLDEIARGLIQDFADLSKAGFDVTVITEGMSKAINNYVQQAMATGTEVPSAMRPLLEKMIDLGLLTDAAGNKIEDLGGLTFSTTLTEGFRSVVDAINELTRALTGGLGGALDELGRKKVVIPITFERDEDVPTPSSAATGGIVGFGRILPFGRGGLVPFTPIGTDIVPAMLTPGEIVLNAAQQGRVAAAVAGGGSTELRMLHGEMRALRRDMQRQAEQAAVERTLQGQLLPKAIKAAIQQVA